MGPDGARTEGNHRPRVSVTGGRVSGRESLTRRFRPKIKRFSPSVSAVSVVSVFQKLFAAGCVLRISSFFIIIYFLMNLLTQLTRCPANPRNSGRQRACR